ncbi:hypothetical protein [Enterobacter hormaechei]|uniref:hypothetical protein n=1 Tax=Enterobacter hormaechei TaxID=158836 RepID=UPI000A7197DB|nr:hypothetical protein [Enterobacter hormaechei]
MSTTLKEWLLKTIAELEQERNATPGAVNEDAARALAAMKLALASLEEEGKLSSFIATQESLGGEFESVLTENIESLYVTSNPAVKITSRDLDEGFDKWYTRDECGTNSIAPEWFSEALKPVFLETWRACRAAMLQGAEPVTTAYKLPEGWVVVPVEPTEEMIAAAMCSNDVLFDKKDDTLFRVQHGEIWRAMLSTAPQQEADNG